MHVPRRAGLLLLAALAGLSSSPATAATKPRAEGPAYSQLIADGVRYAAFKPSRDQLRLRDDRTGTGRQISLADGCVPISARYGTFLVSCFINGRSSYLLLDGASGSLRPVPGAGSTFDPSTGSLDRIGRYWIQGTDSSSGHPTTLYLDWRTGARSPYGAELDQSDFPRDLDRRNLRGLGPRQFPAGFSDADGPFIVRQVGKERPRDFQDLVLYRGDQRLTVLDRCHTYCGSVGLSAGRVIWSRGAVGFGYDIKARRRSHWRLPRSITSVGGDRQGIQATRRHVFFSAPTLSTDTPPFLLYSATWP